MAKQKIRIGVIGGGMIAQAHMKNFAKDPRTEIRWIAEISDTARQASAEAFSIPHATADYRDVLRDPQVDAVVVCTPPASHVAIGLAALRAGKHLLMEKPLAVELKDARRLVAEARKHPKLKVSGCSCRHARLNPKFAIIRDLIASGRLGEVYFIHHRALSRQGRGGIEYNPKAKWFLDKKIAGGGPLYDWGVYDLSFHLGVVGDPALVAVDAFCRNGLDRVDPGAKVFTVEEHGAAFMTFAGGLKYYWERSNNVHNEAPNQTSIYGTKGGLRFAYTTWGEVHEIEIFDVARDGKGKARKSVIKVNMKKHPGDMQALGRAWVDYLAGERKAPPMPLALELKNLETLQAVYRAARW